MLPLPSISNASRPGSLRFDNFNTPEIKTGTIKGWIQDPFHAVHTLNPGLRKIEYSLCREGDGSLGSRDARAMKTWVPLKPGNQHTVSITVDEDTLSELSWILDS